MKPLLTYEPRDKFMLYIFTLLFSFAAISAEVGFSYKEEGNVHYVVPYEIAGKWMVDEYQVAPGKLQQRISQKIYNNSVGFSVFC